MTSIIRTKSNCEGESQLGSVAPKRSPFENDAHGLLSSAHVNIEGRLSQRRFRNGPYDAMTIWRFTDSLSAAPAESLSVTTFCHSTHRLAPRAKSVVNRATCETTSPIRLQPVMYGRVRTRLECEQPTALGREHPKETGADVRRAPSEPLLVCRYAALCQRG